MGSGGLYSSLRSILADEPVAPTTKEALTAWEYRLSCFVRANADVILAALKAADRG